MKYSLTNDLRAKSLSTGCMKARFVSLFFVYRVKSLALASFRLHNHNLYHMNTKNGNFYTSLIKVALFDGLSDNVCGITKRKLLPRNFSRSSW